MSKDRENSVSSCALNVQGMTTYWTLGSSSSEYETTTFEHLFNQQRITNFLSRSQKLFSQQFVPEPSTAVGAQILYCCKKEPETELTITKAQIQADVKTGLSVLGQSNSHRTVYVSRNGQKELRVEAPSGNIKTASSTSPSPSTLINHLFLINYEKVTDLDLVSLHHQEPCSTQKVLEDFVREDLRQGTNQPPKHERCKRGSSSAKRNSSAYQHQLRVLLSNSHHDLSYYHSRPPPFVWLRQFSFKPWEVKALS